MSSGSAGAPALSNNSTNSVAKEKSGNISGDEYLSQEEEVLTVMILRIMKPKFMKNP